MALRASLLSAHLFCSALLPTFHCSPGLLENGICAPSMLLDSASSTSEAILQKLVLQKRVLQKLYFRSYSFQTNYKSKIKLKLTKLNY
ncbi:hypothetical protein MTR_3g072883 [Medicago truncatula]|uniref:Transmembrane protein n=1 Tax=Medicago truncatula TaxID=3880 RepID=A0A072V9J7_MEDTR|nr:hypothetical protein MTR_3g072883 [Medicago truncatula]